MNRGTSYWDIIRRSGVSRRRLLAGSAAAGLGVTAASLIGCGGGDEGGQTRGEFSFDKPSDTTRSAKPGGMFRAYTTRDIVSWDPITSRSFTAQASVGAWAYSRLLQFKAGINEPAPGDVEADLAGAWEVVDGGARLILRLRDNAKWDQRAPTSGRAVESSDVAFSWKKFEAGSTYRTDLAHSVNSAVPVEDVQTPDRSTAVFKLAFPWAALLPMIASSNHFYIMPKEADGGFNPEKEARGSGAWYISRYDASTYIEYKKNPNWYRKDRPFVDGFEYPIVPEYAQLLAQFRAKNIWFSPATQEDVLATKRDLPELLLRQGESFSTSQVGYFFFGWNPGSPFVDERVRQAVSMSIDRDLFIDTFNNVSEFTKQGISIPTAWNSHVAAGWGSFWLNPRDEKAFGPNAKYFKHDIAEAKKLLSAAGHVGGLDTDAYFIPTSQYGTDFPRRVEVTLSMMDEAGIRSRRRPVDYQSEFLPKYSQSNGKFVGFAMGARSVSADIGPTIGQTYQAGSRVIMPEPDPKLVALFDQQYREFDFKKRVSAWHDIQRYLAKAMYGIGPPGDALGLGLVWPFTQNIGVYRRWVPSSYSSPAETYIHYWIDSTKMRS